MAKVVTRSSAEGDIGKSVKSKVKTCVAGGRDKALCQQLAWQEEAKSIQSQITQVKGKDYVDTTLVNSLKKRLESANKKAEGKGKKQSKVESKRLKKYKKK